MDTKYPKEITSVVRNKTMYVNAMFNRANGTKGVSPLHFFNRKTTSEVFSSYYPVTIINEDKKALSANIPFNDMEALLSKSQVIIMKAWNNEEKIVEAAAPVVFRAGKHKGMTPLNVLNNEGADALKEEYLFYKKNLSKYPSNKTLLNEIAIVISNCQKGIVQKELKVKPVIIYNSGIKPLIRKKREDGLCKVYEIRISYIPQKYPFVFTIENYYAPVNKKEDGTLNVIKREMKDLQRNEMALSIAEYVNVTNDIQRVINAYAMLYAGKCIKEAEEISLRERNKSYEN